MEDLLGEVHDELRLDSFSTDRPRPAQQPANSSDVSTFAGEDQALAARFKALQASGDTSHPSTMRARLDRMTGTNSTESFSVKEFLFKEVDEETQIQQLIQQTIAEANLENKQPSQPKTTKKRKAVPKKQTKRRRHRKYESDTDSFSDSSDDSLSSSSSFSDSSSYSS
jgi:hypothetical protein